MNSPDGLFEVVDEAGTEDGTRAEVVQINRLRGSSDIRTAEMLFYAGEVGLAMKMVRLQLENTRLRVEPGALYFMKGKLEMKASTGGGFLKGISRKLTSGESLFVSEVHGSGTVYLEPTFGHFLLYTITERDEGVIVDKSRFYAGTKGLDISIAAQRHVSAGVLGGEGWFQTRIAGQGIAVIYSPVPRHEIIEMTLNDGEELSVDGNIAVMRTATVDFRVRKSGKSWVATSVSGEGFLQIFTGPGTVWLAPTQGIYEKLSSPEKLRELAQPPGSLGTMTGNRNDQ